MFSSAEKETVTVIELDGDTSASNKRKQSDLDQYVVTTSTSQKLTLTGWLLSSFFL
jgi:hypothetical protein